MFKHKIIDNLKKCNLTIFSECLIALEYVQLFCIYINYIYIY